MHKFVVIVVSLTLLLSIYLRLPEKTIVRLRSSLDPNERAQVFSSVLRQSEVAKVNISAPYQNRKEILESADDDGLLHIVPDKEIGEFVLWDDPLCSKYGISFGVNVPKNLLMTFPHSGCKWILNMMEGATGIVTGTYYPNDRSEEFGDLNKLTNALFNKTVLGSTFEYRTIPNFRLDTPTVILMRNPARSIEALYRKAHGDPDDKKEDNYQLLNVFVEQTLKWWENVYLAAIRQLPNLLPIHYEHMKVDPIIYLRQILRFLKLPVDEERLQCVSFHFDRKLVKKNNPTEHYNDQLREIMKKTIQNMDNLLIKRGFPPMPNYTLVENYL